MVTPGNVETKMDTLRRKGRKQYLSFRKATRTGAPVEEGHFSLHRNKKVLISDRPIADRCSNDWSCIADRPSSTGMSTALVRCV